MENKNRTISILLDILNSDVWVYLKDIETCRRFYADAEAEGFMFGDILPTDSGLDDIIAVHRDRTLGHVGFVGHQAFHSGLLGSVPLIRIDYVKYIAGEQDFYYCADNNGAERIGR